MTEETLFHLVLQQQAGARGAFLAEACGGDAALQRRLEALLLAHEQPAEFWARPVVPAPAPAPPLEGVGSRLGPYRLLAPLGVGGMGVVFLAEQDEPVRRQVALKVIKPGMDSRQVLARFAAERQALALMAHPHIAQVLDAGTSSAGRPYFVMELCRGVPLTDHCERQKLGIRARLGLFVTVCQAVQHAHLKGIIHRDLKPSNVLVTDDAGGAGVVKVIDFGIAKALSADLLGATALTGGAQLLGTPMYMSPEQAELHGDVDTRSDVYSLGVLLYELLTGMTPFDRQRLQAASFDEVRQIIREEEPPRPSTRLSTLGQATTALTDRPPSAPRQLSRLLRGELDWIVMKALDKDRTRRYESASALAADVERQLRDEPVLARPPSMWYRARKFARRQRQALALAALAAAVLLLAGGGGGWLAWDRAAQATARRDDLAQRAADTERTVTGALARVEPALDQLARLPRATSRDTEAVRRLWRQADAALGHAEAALSSGPASTETAERVAAVRAALVHGQAEDEARHAQRVRQEQLRHDLDEACFTEQRWHDNRFDHAGASAQYAAAFAAYGLALELDRPTALVPRLAAEDGALRDVLIDALDHWLTCATVAGQAPLAAALTQLADAADADRWGRRVRAAARAGDRPALTALGSEARQRALAPAKLIVLAAFLHHRGERDEALALLRWARGQHPTDFHIHSCLGFFLVQRPGCSALEREEAIGCYRVAIALRPEVCAVYCNLGIALLDQQRVDESLAVQQAAIRRNDRYAPAHHFLGNALTVKGELGAAIAAYRRAIAVDPRYGLVYPNLGAALAAQGQPAAAIAAFEQAIACNLRSAADYHNLGTALLAGKRPAEAVVAFRQALRVGGDRAGAYVDLGDALAAVQQLDDALAAYRKALDCDAKHAPAHAHLGTALMKARQLPAAIAAFRQALALEPQLAVAHLDLGLALAAGNDWDGALAALRQAIECDPKLAVAQHNLGGVLLQLNRHDEAIAALRAAIRLEPKHDRCAQCWFHIATSLRRLGRLDEAIDAYRQAIEREPRDALSHFNLGHAYFVTGRFAEGCAATREALRRFAPDHPLRAHAESNLQGGERLLALEGRLRGVLAGTVTPRDTAERLGLLEVCRLQRRHAAAARLYADAFAADPTFARRQRYRAACAAILAAAGRGSDSAALTDADRAQLRRQALAWLAEVLTKRVSSTKDTKEHEERRKE